MENLQDYITDPFKLGRHEADSLESLREKYPYFQALHILIAKCHKNQNTFGYNKNLKLASLYAGDRKVLFNFINSEPEPIEEKIAEKADEIVKPIEEVIDEPVSVSEQVSDTSEKTEIEENVTEINQPENVTAPEAKVYPLFVWDEKLKAYKRVKPEEPIEAEPEKKPIFEVVKKPEVSEEKEISEPVTESLKVEVPIEEEAETIDEEEPVITEVVLTEDNSVVKKTEDNEIEEIIDEQNIEIPEEVEKYEEVSNTDNLETTEVTVEEILEKIEINEPIEENEIDISEEVEKIDDVSDLENIETEEDAIEETFEEIEISEDKAIKNTEITDEEITSQPIEINEGVEETEASESIHKTSNAEADEKDFYSWLDNFALTDTKKITEDEQKSEIAIEQEEEIISKIETSTQDEIVSENSTKLIEDETFHSHLPLNFEEINDEQEAEYDPAAWAEIAYEIQAFVKTPDVPEEKEFKIKKVSKDEIDNLLDKFIQHNPRISRPKAEFYKPDNMARKSEEFHADVVSETLAQLFYKQGLLHKSLEIYEKLMLQNPDKKDIFAARIKTIKEELINRL